jgi:hypothetical protein
LLFRWADFGLQAEGGEECAQHCDAHLTPTAEHVADVRGPRAAFGGEQLYRRASFVDLSAGDAARCLVKLEDGNGEKRAALCSARPEGP